MKFKKIFLGSLFYSFIFWYCVFSAGLPLVVRAEDETPTPEAAVTVEASTTPSESPAATEMSVEGSTSEATETPSSTLSDEISALGVESLPQGSCTPTSTPDVLIETGDAMSGSLSESTGNVLGVEVFSEGSGTTESAPSTESSGAPSSQDGCSSSCSSDVTVASTQDADSETVSTASATTGENTALGGAVELVTGDALAIASSINVSNISLIGSNMYYLVDTISGTESGDINLYEIMLQLQMSSLSNIPLDLIVLSSQTANQNTSSSASSETGGNLVCAGTAGVGTGDATSVSSSIDLANFLLVGSSGLFSIVNVAGTLDGDIILPNLSGVGESSPWSSIYVVNNQTANIQTSSTADSNTGENILNASGSTTTGSATSASNSVSIANVLKIGDSWGLVILNIFGNWQGTLQNWEAPGAVSQVGMGSTVLEQDGEGSGATCTGCGSLTVFSSQDANITNTSQADSNTGGNVLNAGSGNLTTGDALSISNSFSLANLVGIGGNFFVGVFNVVGNWFGDLVVAYPDLAVSITDNKDEVHPGESLEYQLTVTNNGDGYANGVGLGFTGPSGFVNEGPSTWDIPQMAPGESLTFTVGGYISPDFASEGALTSIARVAMADDEESEDNNEATDTTKLTIQLSNDESSNPDHTNPNLKISITNNVAAYVFPGDTVLATIVVENDGPVRAKNVNINGSLSNDHPMPAIPISWSVGDMDPGRKITIQFSISLIKDLPEGNYHLAALARGYNSAGDEVNTSIAVSNFWVKVTQYLSRIATPVDASEGEVLGATATVPNGVVSGGLFFGWKKYLPYIFLASLVALFGSTLLRRKFDRLPLFPVLPSRRRKKKEEEEDPD